MDEPRTYIQSKVNQKEKNKFYILMYIYMESRKSIDGPICREAVETDLENRLVDTVRKEKRETN